MDNSAELCGHVVKEKGLLAVIAINFTFLVT